MSTPCRMTCTYRFFIRANKIKLLKTKRCYVWCLFWVMLVLEWRKSKEGKQRGQILRANELGIGKVNGELWQEVDVWLMMGLSRRNFAVEWCGYYVPDLKYATPYRYPPAYTHSLKDICHGHFIFYMCWGL